MSGSWHARTSARDGGSLVVLCPAFQTSVQRDGHGSGTLPPIYRANALGSFSRPVCSRREVFYLDSLGMFASLANKFLLRQQAPNEGQVKFWDGFIIPVSRVLDPSRSRIRPVDR